MASTVTTERWEHGTNPRPTLLKITQVTSGQAAAVAVVDLMDRTATAVDPTALVTAYAAIPGGSS